MGAFEVRVGDVGEGTELQQVYRLMDLRQKGFFGRGGGKVKQMDGGGQCELKLQWLPRDQEDDVDLKRRQKKSAVRLQVNSERRRRALARAVLRGIRATGVVSNVLVQDDCGRTTPHSKG